LSKKAERTVVINLTLLVQLDLGNCWERQWHSQ